MAIKDYFAKNGYIRNVIFIIASSLAIVMLITYLLMGRSFFLHIAPVLIFGIIGGFYFRPSKLYLTFCSGMLLQYGLFSGLMGYLILGPVLPVFIYLTVGLIGYLLLVTSIWQAVLGEWKLPRQLDILIQTIAVLGLILSCYLVIYAETHQVADMSTQHNQTY